MSTAAILVLLTILLPWLGGLLVWITGNRHPRAQHVLAVASSLGAAAISIWLITAVSSEHVLTIRMGGAFGDFNFTADGLGVTLTGIACCVGSLAVIFSVDYMHDDAQLGRYYAQVLLFIGAMSGLALTTNLLLVFFFWELTALTSSLISFYNDDPKAVKAG